MDNGYFKSSNAENDENQEKKALLRFVGLDSGDSVRFRPFSNKQIKLFFFTCKQQKFWFGVTFASLNSQKSSLNTFSKLIQMHLFSFFFLSKQ